MRYSPAFSATIAIVTIVTLGLAGCGNDAPDEATGISGTTEDSNMNIDPRLELFVSQARRELAQRIEIDDAEISVIEAEFVTWPNGALGCPSPNMMYTQALVPGYRIRLRADGSVHDYHGAKDGPPAHCPADRARPPSSSDFSGKTAT